SFFGDIFNGLVHGVTDILVGTDEDGNPVMGDSITTLPDPNVPPEYKQPGFKGTLPVMPGIIFREGEHTAIQSSEFSYKPPTDVGIVSGGHSMPGVNELIKAAVVMAGDLTAMIPGVPPMGGVADAILAPLYTDTIL